MACHKCGYDYSGNGACPKCGANAIVVSEDYLRRKREYEESGKISVGNVTFRQSDDKSDMVNGEELEEEDVLITAYKKMKARAAGAFSSNTSKKKILHNLADKVTSKKKDSPKSEKNSEKKSAISIDKSKMKKAAIFAMGVLFVVLAIAGIVAVVTKPQEKVYMVSSSSHIDEKNVVTYVVNEKEAYIYHEGKKLKVSDSPVERSWYNKNFSTIIFESQNKIFCYAGGKVTELSLEAKSVTDVYIETDGKYGVISTFDGNVQSLYKCNQKGEMDLICSDEQGKELIGISGGNVIYTDIAYSPINGVNEVTLKAYINSKNVTLLENYVDAVVFGNGKLIALNEENQVFSIGLNKSIKKDIILENVTHLYSQTGSSVYTSYGSKNVDKTYPQIVIVKSGNNFVSVDAGEGFKTKKLFSEKSSMVEIIYNEKSNRINYVVGNELKEIDKKASQQKKITSFVYNDKKNELVYATSDGKLIRENQNGKKQLETGVSKVREAGNSGDYIYTKGESEYIVHFGKTKGILVDASGDAKILRSGKFIYAMINDKVIITNKKGKVVKNCEKVNEIWVK